MFINIDCVLMAYLFMYELVFHVGGFLFDMW